MDIFILIPFRFLAAILQIKTNLMIIMFSIIIIANANCCFYYWNVWCVLIGLGNRNAGHFHTLRFFNPDISLPLDFATRTFPYPYITTYIEIYLFKSHSNFLLWGFQGSNFSSHTCKMHSMQIYHQKLEWKEQCSA